MLALQIAAAMIVVGAICTIIDWALAIADKVSQKPQPKVVECALMVSPEDAPEVMAWLERQPNIIIRQGPGTVGKVKPVYPSYDGPSIIVGPGPGGHSDN